MGGTIRRATIAAALAAVVCAGAAAAQAPTTESALSIERTDQPATLTYFNRPITVLRARVAGRSPRERADAAARVLDDLVASGATGPIARRPFEAGVMVAVGTRGVIVLFAADVDDLEGETLDDTSSKAVARLGQAMQEAADARQPGVLAREAATAAAALALAIALLWGIARARRFAAQRLVTLAERKAVAAGAPIETLRASRVLEIERGAVTAIGGAADVVVIYSVVTFILRRFPYTRPWGESMLGFLLNTAATLGLGFIRALPGLFTVAVILLLARFVVRLIGVWFNAAERGQVRVRWIYPETAQPTRRLVSTLVWLLAIVVAYPYMPGSDSEAFKGVSVFLGLMITFGSSGAVNQIMSGFMVTYSRALRVGDFVRIGDSEGTVIHLGVLSVKIRTVRNEEVTIPNAVVVSQTTTDFTRFGNTEGVFIPTSVTIGYDTPWRQVEALLLQAASQTAGLRREPKPVVLQEGLQDFYVKYTLLVCLERQEQKPFALDELHANIQDLFNEYGVQIMSPNYVLDPERPKVVPKAHWFAAPASQASDLAVSTPGTGAANPPWSEVGAAPAGAAHAPSEG